MTQIKSWMKNNKYKSFILFFITYITAVFLIEHIKLDRKIVIYSIYKTAVVAAFICSYFTILYLIYKKFKTHFKSVKVIVISLIVISIISELFLPDFEPNNYDLHTIEINYDSKTIVLTRELDEYNFSLAQWQIFKYNLAKDLKLNSILYKDSSKIGTVSLIYENNLTRSDYPIDKILLMLK